MKYLVVTLFTVVLFSCRPVKEPAVASESIHVQKPEQKTVIAINPAVLMRGTGSSFFNLFASYWRLGRFQQLIAMTDSSAILKYGVPALLKAYRHVNLAPKFTLKSVVDEGNGGFTLNYSGILMASRSIRRCRIRVLKSGEIRLLVDDIKYLFH
jgi:hypothetical protein